jgi:O-Antigen ligase
MIRCRSLAERRFTAAEILWVPLAGVALGQRFVFPGVSVADLCLGAFVLLALREQRGEPWTLPRWTPWLVGFVAWALVAGLVAARDPFFSAGEFARSAVKLVFYTAAALVLARTVAAAGVERTGQIAGQVFAISASLAIAIYLALLAHVPLPYDLICGHPECRSAYYYELRWFGEGSARGLTESVFLRAQGLAGEPARLGMLLGLALAFLLLSRRVRPSPAACALVAVAAVLTFSLAGYALLLPVLALFALRLLRASRHQRRWAAGILVALLAVAALPPVARTLKRSIVVRSQRILEGRADSSARLRVVGSWDLALLLAREHPVTGVGLGNFDVRVTQVAPLTPGGHMIDHNVQGWNALAYVLATTGTVGLVLFVLLVYAALRPQPALAIVFLIGMFADGTVLGPAFWTFLVLYAAGGEPAPEPTAPAG